MTRAEDMLVILHSGSSYYVEAPYRALATVPPQRQGAAADSRALAFASIADAIRRSCRRRPNPVRLTG